MGGQHLFPETPLSTDERERERLKQLEHYPTQMALYEKKTNHTLLQMQFYIYPLTDIIY